MITCWRGIQCRYNVLQLSDMLRIDASRVVLMKQPLESLVAKIFNHVKLQCAMCRMSIQLVERDEGSPKASCDLAQQNACEMGNLLNERHSLPRRTPQRTCPHGYPQKVGMRATVLCRLTAPRWKIAPPTSSPISSP